MMRLPRRPAARLLPQCEELEARVVPASTIAEALDLPDGVSATLSGNSQSVQIRTLPAQSSLLNFPTGRDEDYLVLSSGVASQITQANSSGSQGTDLGSSGVSGDTAIISFTLPVPESPTSQRLKLDFMFLSEEFPEYVGSSFNDFFTARVNNVNIARDEFGNEVRVNNVFFISSSAPGTFFDGRTSLLTASYNVPANTSSLDVQLSVGDVGDGIYDSAALIDNVRFENSQLVYLDFDGENIGSFFGPLTSLSLPAFSGSDVGSSASSTSAVIASVVQKVKDLFAPFQIDFVTSKPASGEYMHAVIGGSNDSPITLFNPLEALKFGTFQPKFSDYAGLGSNTLFGQAQGNAPDFGNFTRDDRLVVFSQEFATFPSFAGESPSTLEDRLAVTIAHEVGHNLGLRHVLDTLTGDVMKKFAPLGPTASFGNQLMTLAESHFDGASQQNDFAYLRSVLGLKDASASLDPGFNFNDFYDVIKIDLSGMGPVFNASIGFASPGGGASSASGGELSLPSFIEMGQLNGPVSIVVPKSMGTPNFFFAASTTPGGTPNVFSGSAQGGSLSFDSMFVPFTGTIPFSAGTTGSMLPVGFLSVTGGTPTFTLTGTLPTAAVTAAFSSAGTGVASTTIDFRAASLALGGSASSVSLGSTLSSSSLTQTSSGSSPAASSTSSAAIPVSLLSSGGEDSEETTEPNGVVPASGEEDMRYRPNRKSPPPGKEKPAVEPAEGQPQEPKKVLPMPPAENPPSGSVQGFQDPGELSRTDGFSSGEATESPDVSTLMAGFALLSLAPTAAWRSRNSTLGRRTRTSRRPVRV